MKKLLLLICIGFFSLGITHEAKASHAAGGEITYRYVGDSTGIPYNYCITLTVYRRNETGSAGLGNTFTVNINSTCFSQQNVTVTRLVPPAGQAAGDGGFIVPNYTPCIDELNPGSTFYKISQHIYKACVVLPGKCADFTFSWSLCCRNNNITNLATKPNLYLESKLNNTRQPNTSPRFVNPAAKSFCVNTTSPFVWSQNAVEPDMDSLNFTLQQPWTASNTPIAWAAGYTTQQPMTTANGFNLNAKNGTFFFQPTNVENDVIKIVVEEWRYDTIIQLYYQVGTAIRELQVPVVSQCNPVAVAGIAIDSTIQDQNGQPAGTALYTVDSLLNRFNITRIGNPVNGSGPAATARLPVVPYKCFDSIVTLEFDKGLVCDSFSVDGSEFRIIGPDQVLRPVVGVETNCGPDLLTRKVNLLLHKSLDTAGDFLLYIKTGNDGNSLVNECGFPVDSFFAIIIRIDNCPYPDYKLSNVTVDRDEDIIIDWEIDINSFVPAAFTSWRILRANMDDQYYILDELDSPTDVNVRSFKDTSLDPIDVDLTQFQYIVQLVQNGKPYPPTNRIFSILLNDTVNAEEDGNLYDWSTYIGWDSAFYEFQYGKYDTTQQKMVWQTSGGPRQEYFNDSYTYPLCEENRDTSGLYAFRVLATDPKNLPPGGFISESNWLYYSIDCEEPEPDKKPPLPVIPTVFTPNGDGNNDMYKLNTDYQYAEIGIYNRWGKAVLNFSGNPDNLEWDGTDQNSGQKVADGVYYYIITLRSDLDDGTGNITTDSQEFTGSVTIFSNGTR